MDGDVTFAEQLGVIHELPEGFAAFGDVLTGIAFDCAAERLIVFCGGHGLTIC